MARAGRIALRGVLALLLLAFPAASVALRTTLAQTSQDEVCFKCKSSMLAPSSSATLDDRVRACHEQTRPPGAEYDLSFLVVNELLLEGATKTSYECCLRTTEHLRHGIDKWDASVDVSADGCNFDNQATTAGVPVRRSAYEWSNFPGFDGNLGSNTCSDGADELSAPSCKVGMKASSAKPLRLARRTRRASTEEVSAATEGRSSTTPTWRSLEWRLTHHSTARRECALLCMHRRPTTSTGIGLQRLQLLAGACDRLGVL